MSISITHNRVLIVSPRIRIKVLSSLVVRSFIFLERKYCLSLKLTQNTQSPLSLICHYSLAVWYTSPRFLQQNMPRRP